VIEIIFSDMSYGGARGVAFSAARRKRDTDAASAQPPLDDYCRFSSIMWRRVWGSSFSADV